MVQQNLLTKNMKKELFQYILCYGSTAFMAFWLFIRKNFNTSYVMVQPSKKKYPISINVFQYILCCGSTVSSSIIWEILFRFQYILCCGSTERAIEKQEATGHFNTSYVVVQQLSKNLSLI